MKTNSQTIARVYAMWRRFGSDRDWAPVGAQSRAGDVFRRYRQPSAPSNRNTPSTSAVANPHAASTFSSRSTYDLPASTHVQ